MQSHQLDLAKATYGHDVDIYRDILGVSPDACDKVIQAAFVARRYELFTELQNTDRFEDDISGRSRHRIVVDKNGRKELMSERQFTERKMDTLIASYRLLSDANKRREYDLYTRSAFLLKKKTSKPKGKGSHNNTIGDSDHSPLGVQDLKQVQPQNLNIDGNNNSREDSRGEQEIFSLNFANGGPSPARDWNLKSKTPIKTPRKLFGTPETSHTSILKNDKRLSQNKNADKSVSSDDQFNLNESLLDLTNLDAAFTVDDEFNFDEAAIKPSFESNSTVNIASFGAEDYSDTGSEYDDETLSGGESSLQKDRSCASESTYESGTEESYTEVDRREKQKSQIKGFRRSRSSPKNIASASKQSLSDTRKVRWTKSVDGYKENTAQTRSKAKNKKEDLTIQELEEMEMIKYEQSNLSSWLRSKDFDDQADFVDDVGREIAGAASDTLLAFTQVFNAFKVDEDAIDSMAQNIGSATDELQRGRYGRKYSRK